MNPSTPPSDVTEKFVAAAHGDLKTVQALLDEHPSLLNSRSSQDESALMAASHTGQRAVIEFLLSRGAVLDVCAAAVLGRHAELVGLLDADPQRLQARGAHGLPLMYYAALGGQQDVLDLLLARGADINAGDGVTTALHVAAMTGRASLARWLLEQGARRDCTDHSGKTALDLARQFKRADVEALLDPSAAS